MRIDEARARVIGASLALPSNPTFAVDAGRRTGAVSSGEYSVEVAQDLDLPRRRSARLEAARAAVSEEEARARDVERTTLLDVATSFLRALEATERAAAAADSTKLADDALRIAERRYSAGDVAQLDVNLARTAVARSAAETRAAAARRTGRLTELQVMLGMALPPTVSGSLRDVTTIASNEMIARAADRPAIRIVEAAIDQAEAELRLARSLRWPDFGVRATYSREEGDRVVLGGIGISLPVFNRGQEAAAVATARLSRLRVERDALTRTIEAEVRGAIASFDALRAASAEYQRTVLPLVEENERLALESYEVGQIGLADLLLVRREGLDARRALTDQLIETRLSEVQLRARTGVWE
jgi:cobalt-zinc-cadmium efflux system outer membrane protein